MSCSLNLLLITRVKKWIIWKIFKITNKHVCAHSFFLPVLPILNGCNWLQTGAEGSIDGLHKHAIPIPEEHIVVHHTHVENHSHSVTPSDLWGVEGAGHTYPPPQGGKVSQVLIREQGSAPVQLHVLVFHFRLEHVPVTSDELPQSLRWFFPASRSKKRRGHAHILRIRLMQKPKVPVSFTTWFSCLVHEDKRNTSC